MERRSLKVADIIADSDVIDLGGRKLDVLNLPGHTTESVVLLDKSRNQVFTGDFVYRHLGGIIAFAPGSDLVAYKANSARLLRLTNVNTLFFGAHGIPRFGRDWLTLLDSELDKNIKGEANTDMQPIIWLLASHGRSSRMASYTFTARLWSIHRYSGPNGCCWYWGL